MLVVTLQGLDWETRSEIIGDNLSEKAYNTAKEALTNGREACVLCVACEGGHKPEHQYYDIVTANGMQFGAVSGYHLKGIAAYK